MLSTRLIVRYGNRKTYSASQNRYETSSDVSLVVRLPSWWVRTFHWIWLHWPSSRTFIGTTGYTTERHYSLLSVRVTVASISVGEKRYITGFRWGSFTPVDIGVTLMVSPSFMSKSDGVCRRSRGFPSNVNVGDVLERIPIALATPVNTLENGVVCFIVRVIWALVPCLKRSTIFSFGGRECWALDEISNWSRLCVETK
jgi:hypothetical protein